MVGQVARIVPTPKRARHSQALIERSELTVLPVTAPDLPIPCRILLADLSSPVNIGSIIRTAAVFNVEVAIFDPRGILAQEAAYQTAMDFSLGLLAGGVPIDGPCHSPMRYGRFAGRKLATVPKGGSEVATGFAFRSDDVVMIGNEYEGLRQDTIDSADITMTIPMPQFDLKMRPPFKRIEGNRRDYSAVTKGACLSASMAAGIICYEAFSASRSR